MLVRWSRALLAVLLFAVAASAQTIELSGGGSIGGIVDEDRSTPETIVIRTITGGVIGIPREQVHSIDEPTARELEYRRHREQMPDTIEGHLRLAAWCKANRLREYQTGHLLEILRRDADHLEARRLLGYRRRDGRWLTSEQWWKSQGYVRYRGRWRLPQQIQILQRREHREEVAGRWYRHVKLWHGWVRDDPGRRALGISKLHEIDDPAALPALGRFLAPDPSPEIRLLFIDVVADLPGTVAVKALVVRSLVDNASDVRHAAVDKLLDRNDRAAIVMYAQALQHQNNQIVRGAADALGRLGNVAAVEPLIEALVTHHLVAVRRPGAPSFGSSQLIDPADVPAGVDAGSLPAGSLVPVMARQGTAFSPGGRPPAAVPVPVENHEALDALNKLTGRNFGFDKSAWKSWWESYLDSRDGTLLEKP